MARIRSRRGILWVLCSLAALVLVVWGLGKAGHGPLASSRAASQAPDSSQVAAADSSGTGQAQVSGDGPDKGKPGQKQGKKGKEGEIVPVPVEVAHVQKRGIAAYYRAASVVEADRLVDLVSKVQGNLKSLNADEGSWVKAGDVLAEIENERERIGLRQAELKLAEQQRQLERTQSMLDQGLISRQEFDDIKAAHDLAETERDLAQIALNETIIRAPFAGQVTERKIVQGQHITPGEALFTLADFQPLRVRVHLPEAIARKVAVGQRVLISPESVEEPVEATVEMIAPVVDPATSTVRLTLLLQDGAQAVKVGGFVKVRITTDSHQEALAIPKLALVEDGGLRSVFIAEGDTVRKVEIQTGLYDETHVEILDGLPRDAFVVTLGQGGLRTGSHIKVINADEAGWPLPTKSDTNGEATGEAAVALTPEN